MPTRSPSVERPMLRVASDGLVGAPPLLTRPSDLSQLRVNAGMGSRPLAVLFGSPLRRSSLSGGVQVPSCPRLFRAPTVSLSRGRRLSGHAQIELLCRASPRDTRYGRRCELHYVFQTEAPRSANADTLKIADSHQSSNSRFGHRQQFRYLADCEQRSGPTRLLGWQLMHSHDPVLRKLPSDGEVSKNPPGRPRLQNGQAAWLLAVLEAAEWTDLSRREQALLISETWAGMPGAPDIRVPSSIRQAAVQQLGGKARDPVQLARQIISCLPAPLHSDPRALAQWGREVDAEREHFRQELEVAARRLKRVARRTRLVLAERERVLLEQLPSD